jgi:RimJ/RimL family protein N-acetyltransferase
MVEAPRLQGSSLVLVPFAAEHLTARYVGWLNDHMAMQFSENRHRRHDLESCRAYTQAFQDGPHMLWAILERSSGSHIGNISAHVDVPNRIADIGILLGDRSCWGRGYGREAWRLVQEHQLGPAACRKVEAGAMASNIGMIRVFDACGMHEESRRCRHFLVDGREIDLVQYAIFAR